jgi:hypothetical protein
MDACIHQEVDFGSSPARVYQALLDERQFGAFTGAPARLGIYDQASIDRALTVRRWRRLWRPNGHAAVGLVDRWIARERE